MDRMPAMNEVHKIYGEKLGKIAISSKESSNSYYKECEIFMGDMKFFTSSTKIVHIFWQ